MVILLINLINLILSGRRLNLSNFSINQNADADDDDDMNLNDQSINDDDHIRNKSIDSGCSFSFTIVSFSVEVDTFAVVFSSI